MFVRWLWTSRWLVSCYLPAVSLCVESFIGADGGREGVKLEQQVMVTDSGIEILSEFPFEASLLA